MTVARSVDDVLSEHVVFEVECIDRMLCNVYVPGLQYAAGLVGYVHRQLGLPIASTAPLARITEAFDKAVHRFARDHGLAWVDFAKGQRKDDIAHEHLARFTGTEGVVFVGRAQEKTKLFRTERRRDANGAGTLDALQMTTPCRAREIITDRILTSSLSSDAVWALKNGMHPSSAPMITTQSNCCPFPTWPA